MRSCTIPTAFLIPTRRAAVLVFVGLVVFTGCLPHSCRRQDDEALYPSDSLSRQVAGETAADTLRQLWTLQGREGHTLQHPRTVRFVGDGGLAVSDVERNSLFRFGGDGSFRREVTDAGFAVPYLIGTRGDTLVVFNAETDTIDEVAGGRRLTDRAIHFDRPRAESLVYMLATRHGTYAKVVEQHETPFIARLKDAGEIEARVELPGPYWQHAGFLRAWGDQVASLSGFRPLVHLLPRTFESATTPDSLSLVGFDSPMLERSYAFGQGDVTKPPLLTPAAAPVGDTLFVLNLRPGWVQIDAYDREGRLQRRLVERHEGGDQQFYPVDLDARRANGGYIFAVAIRSPEPQVEVYRWAPSSGSTSEGAGGGAPSDQR